VFEDSSDRRRIVDNEYIQDLVPRFTYWRDVEFLESISRSKPTAFYSVSFQAPSSRIEGCRIQSQRARGLRHPVSRDLDHKVPLQDTGRIAERARDLIRRICQSREEVIVRGSVSPDPIHMLLSAQQLVPAKLVQFIKGGRLEKTARGVPRVAKAVLARAARRARGGGTLVGARILLREWRRSR
jgi:hypothetical protein